MGVVIVILIVVVVGLAAWWSWYAKKKRREGLARLAAQYGMQYSKADPFGLLRLPFGLLRKGDGRGCENVMWGTWQQLDCKEFDYWYYEESTDGKGHTQKNYWYFSCVVAEVPLRGADLIIQHETLFTRLADHVGLEDIQFESEDFNRAFNVKCGDPKFATYLVDARMMQWLLGMGKGWSFDLSGPSLLCYTKRRKPEELPQLFGTLKGFSDHVPRMVYEMYGPGGSGTVRAEGS